MAQSKMTFFDLLSSRHSVRAFKKNIVPDGVIEKILNAAITGASAGNLQSYQIFVVTKSDDKKRLVKAAHDQSFIEDAAVVLVFCADPKTSSLEYGQRGEKLFCIQDATIACAYSQLAVHALGLSSVWVGSFEDEKVIQVLRIENSLKPVAILPIGYADEEPEITSRKPLSKICHKI